MSVLHTFWSVKGGSGVTVTAALYATALARRHGATTVVDLCGDQPAALGLPEPRGAGWSDWLATPDGSAEALARLLVDVRDDLTLLPVGATGDWPEGRAAHLADALATLGHVVVDAGVVDPSPTGDGDPRDGLFGALAEVGRTTLVLRPCYLALRRAMKVTAHVDGVVVVNEPERALDATDVERLLGARVLASLDVEPAVARAVDAGLLVQRRHRGILRAVEASV